MKIDIIVLHLKKSKQIANLDLESITERLFNDTESSKLNARHCNKLARLRVYI